MLPGAKTCKISKNSEANLVPKKRGRPPKNLPKPNAMPPKKVGRPRKTVEVVIALKVKPKAQN